MNSTQQKRYENFRFYLEDYEKHKRMPLFSSLSFEDYCSMQVLRQNDVNMKRNRKFEEILEIVKSKIRQKALFEDYKWKHPWIPLDTPLW